MNKQVCTEMHVNSFKPTTELLIQHQAELNILLSRFKFIYEITLDGKFQREDVILEHDKLSKFEALQVQHAFCLHFLPNLEFVELDCFNDSDYFEVQATTCMKIFDSNNLKEIVIVAYGGSASKIVTFAIANMFTCDDTSKINATDGMLRFRHLFFDRKLTILSRTTNF